MIVNNYVVTNQYNLPKIGNVEFITDLYVEFIKRIKESHGKDIWLIGGGKVSALLLNAGLIDEAIIFIMPMILNGGIPLFADTPNITSLKPIHSKTHSTGVQELQYQVIKSDIKEFLISSRDFSGCLLNWFHSNIKF